MIKAAIMIIFNITPVDGHLLKFDTIEECQSVKIEIVEYYKDKWFGPIESDIICIPYNKEVK